MLKLNEAKEKFHFNFNRYMETLCIKIENIIKSFKSEEKSF